MSAESVLVGDITPTMIEAACEVLRTHSVSIDFIDTTDPADLHELLREIYMEMTAARSSNG